MIAIVDYRMGNLRSVEKAFHSLGYPASPPHPKPPGPMGNVHDESW